MAAPPRGHFGAPMSLKWLDLHLAPLDDAAGSVLGTITKLEGERSLRVLAVLNVDGLDSVQHDSELRALGRDLTWGPRNGPEEERPCRPKLRPLPGSCA